MTAYRCYLLDEDGKIRRLAIIESPTDAAALEEAVRQFVASELPTIEVWEKERRVGTIRHSQDRLTMTAQKDREASIDSPAVQS